MILKSAIANVFLEQQALISRKKNTTSREYLSEIKSTGQFIEVISGVRRCGKSTLLMQIMEQYQNYFAYFNFEDSRVRHFELNDFHKLDEIIGRGKAAYFFDEIQNVNSWETFIRELHDRGEKIYITGSNASLLSKELGTRLTGRHIHHELYPFSYKEFLTHKKLKDSIKSFEAYQVVGGFPNYIDHENPEILQTLLKDIVFRDIAIRYGIKNTNILMDLSLYLISNIGKEFTFNSLKKAFSIGSANTVSDFLSWLEDSFLFFYLKRFSYSAKSIAVNPRKVYAIDNGLISCNTLSFSKDKGRLLENLIFLHLHKMYEQIYYFREKSECDFVIFEKNKCKMVMQVCEEIHEDNKEREINGLQEAMDFFNMSEGYIITKDQNDQFEMGAKKIFLIPANQLLSNNY